MDSEMRSIGECVKCNGPVFVVGTWPRPQCRKCGHMGSPKPKPVPEDVFASVQKQLSEAVGTIGKLVDERDAAIAEAERLRQGLHNLMKALLPLEAVGGGASCCRTCGAVSIEGREERHVGSCEYKAALVLLYPAIVPSLQRGVAVCSECLTEGERGPTDDVPTTCSRCLRCRICHFPDEAPATAQGAAAGVDEKERNESDLGAS